MRGFQLDIKGNWGHFKRPETNNNPLTHDLITKTALIGLLGAVLGIERKIMKSMFPILSDDLLYNVQLLNPVNKLAIGLTSHNAIRPTESGTPKSFEILKNPKYRVTIALVDKRSVDIFNKFVCSIKKEETVYPPCLGWHNCPAELEFVSEGNISDEVFDGEFETKGFVLAGKHNPTNILQGFRIGFDKLPTFQNNDFWNLPERYMQVIYPDFPNTISVKGPFREYIHDNVVEKLCLI